MTHNNDKEIIMRIKTALALAVAVASTGAMASDYRVEGGLSYVDLDGDDHIIAVDGTFYFEQVQTARRPLAEAPFLGRNSNISLSYGTLDEADVDLIGLGAEVWVDHFYLSAEFLRADIDVDEIDNYEARLGYMVGDGFLVNVGFADGDSFDKSSILLGTKYVAPVGGNFINLEADLEVNDGDSTLGLVGDYFFNNQFSAGLRLERSDVSGAKTEFGVGAKYFITSTISGELEYITQDSVDAVLVRFAARF